MNTRLIEDALIVHSNVNEVCVIARPGHETARAFVVLNDANERMMRTFCEWCRRDLHDILKGVEVHVLASLPKTRMGTVAQKQLMAIFDSEETWIAASEYGASSHQPVKPWGALSIMS